MFDIVLLQVAAYFCPMKRVFKHQDLQMLSLKVNKYE